MRFAFKLLNSCQARDVNHAENKNYVDDKNYVESVDQFRETLHENRGSVQ